MPKLKTNKGAAKRFRKNGSGGIKHRQGHRNHILTKKGTKRKRHLRAGKLVAAQDQRAVERMLNGS